MSTSTLHLGIFYMPQIYDMGPMALLPLRRKACWGFFSPLKNPTASAGFEPANLGTKGQHATPRPPKPLYILYIRTKIPVSAYALHILNNRHEYDSLEHTIQLLQACSKGKMMNCLESFYMQVLQQQNLLIEKQKTKEPKPLYALGNITKRHTTWHTLRLSLYQANITTAPTDRWVHH